MSNLVIIVAIISTLIGWIAWLIYSFSIFNIKTLGASTVKYWKNRYANVSDTLADLVCDINQALPGSTLVYTRDSNGDVVEGNIKTSNNGSDED